MEAIAGCYPKGEACKRSQTLVILHECHHADLGPVAAGTAAVWDNKLGRLWLWLGRSV